MCPAAPIVAAIAADLTTAAAGVAAAAGRRRCDPLRGTLAPASPKGELTTFYKSHHSPLPPVVPG